MLLPLLASKHILIPPYENCRAGPLFNYTRCKQQPERNIYPHTAGGECFNTRYFRCKCREIPRRPGTVMVYRVLPEYSGMVMCGKWDGERGISWRKSRRTFPFFCFCFSFFLSQNVPGVDLRKTAVMCVAVVPVRQRCF